MSTEEFTDWCGHFMPYEFIKDDDTVHVMFEDLTELTDQSKSINWCNVIKFKVIKNAKE